MKVLPRLLSPALLLLLAGCLAQQPPRAAPPLPLEPPLRKWVLQGWMPFHNIAWVDNERVMFEGTTAAVAGKGGARSLWLWDLKGPPRRLLAASSGACSSKGVITAYRKSAAGQPPQGVRFTGPDFQPQPWQPSRPPGKRFFEPISCTSLPLPPRLRGLSWHALSREDGYLEFGPNDRINERRHVPVYRWDAALQQRLDTGIRIDWPILARVDYAAHDDSYLFYDFNMSRADKEKWRSINAFRIWRINKDFRGYPIDVPGGIWLDQDVSFLPARPGIVITSNNFSRKGEPVGAGIYLLLPNRQSKRIERGLAEKTMISPNGCRLAYSFIPRLDTTLAQGGPRLVAIDLCQVESANKLNQKR